MSGDKTYEDQYLPKKLEFGEAKQKIARYCAYQERAHSEVVEKLYSFGLTKAEVEEILAWLISENFVNEERFAVAFAGGKFRVKRWGKLKIKQFLQQKKVSEYSINKALSEIDITDYTNSIDHLINAGLNKFKANNIYERRHKVSQSLMAKGYEPDIIWERLRLLTKDE